MTADFRNYTNTGDWKDALLEIEGKHLSIFICFQIDQLMRRTGMTFPEAWSASIEGGAVILIPPKRHRKKRAA
jgi:hypothetical protein